MNIIIHRGANQIGGCITEISTDGCKILIDFGTNLPGSKEEELTEEKVSEITAETDAIFFTHYHADHIGLHNIIPSKIPQYIGPGAKEVIECINKAIYPHDKEKIQVELDALKRMKSYQTAKRIDVGEKGKIFLTPYFVSHSAFDAYMFKIECEEKTILHTGDFRKHGYLGKGLLPTLKKYVGQVDILITEGTMLGRKGENVLHENTIQKNIENAVAKHKYIFVLGSSTDMDRLASLHKACKDTGRRFIVDDYQKSILDVFTKYAGAHSDLFKFDNVITEWEFSDLKTHGFVMPIRTSKLKFISKMLNCLKVEKPWLIYSMWNGYAEEGKDYTSKKVIEIRNMFDGRILDGTKDGFHTSGHADTATLQKVCDAVSPRIGIIPIHKDANTDFGSLPNSGKYKVFKESEEINNVKIVIK